MLTLRQAHADGPDENAQAVGQAAFGGTGDYEYEHRPTLNDALDTYRDYEDGEFRRARAVGIFAVKDGLPIGGRLEAMQIMRLMRETRRAT